MHPKKDVAQEGIKGLPQKLRCWRLKRGGLSQDPDLVSADWLLSGDGE